MWLVLPGAGSPTTSKLCRLDRRRKPNSLLQRNGRTLLRASPECRPRSASACSLIRISPSFHNSHDGQELVREQDSRTRNLQANQGISRRHLQTAIVAHNQEKLEREQIRTISNEELTRKSRFYSSLVIVHFSWFIGFSLPHPGLSGVSKKEAARVFIFVHFQRGC